MTTTIDKRSTMTAREYAASLGLAEMGKRGKMSREAYNAIDKAEKDGVVFKLPAHILAAQEREKNGPKRQRRKTAPVVSKTGETHSQNDRHPHADTSEWYKANFGFGAFVRNDEGKTLRVTSEFPDAQGYTHFIDAAGLRFKAKVNARWGTAKGWPERKGYTPNNDK